MSIKLTKPVVDGLKPAEGDVWCWDMELAGFGVRVQPSGRKTFVIRYRVAGTPTQRKMTIARCADMAPDRARELARKRFAEVAEGGDPAGAKRAHRQGAEATVEAMFKGYVAGLRDKNKVSADEVERVLLVADNNAADAIGRAKPAREVTPNDVVRYVGTFYDAGHRAAADKARSYVSSAFSWAIQAANDYTVPKAQRFDWGITRNPAADVAKDAGATKVGDRHLDMGELRQVWAGTLDEDASYSFEVAAAARTLIACGQRVQETLRIDGRDLDLDARLWKMPAEKTKGRKHAHAIPLPEVIIPTLRALVELHGAGPLFPARAGSTGEIVDHTSVNRALSRWNKTAKLPRFTARDLRRTWKSRTADAGIDRFTRDLIQQHAKNDTGSKNYDRADYLPQMREAMDRWSKWLGVVLAGGTPAAPGEPRLKVA